MATTPTRKTSEQELDLWNQQLRASPVYQQFMRSQGLPTDGRVKLSKAQQSGLERALVASGVSIPSGMHIDQGGNLNQKNRLGRNLAIGGAALATLAATGGLSSLGIPGLGGGTAAGGASAAGAGASGASAGLGATAAGSPFLTAAQGGLGWIPGAATGAGTAAGVAGGAAKVAPAVVNAVGNASTKAATSKLPLLASIIAGGAGSILDQRNNARTRATQQAQFDAELSQREKESVRDDALKRALASQDLAAQEASANPYEDVLAQLAAAEQFDRIASTQPLSVDFSSNPYARYIPRVTGGSKAWDASPELRAAAARARATVLGGGGIDPSMTNLANYGTRGSLDLTSGVATGEPRLVGRGTTAGRPPVSSTLPVPGSSTTLSVLGRDLASPELIRTMQDQAVAEPDALISPNDFRVSFDDAQPSMAQRLRMKRQQRKFALSA